MTDFYVETFDTKEDRVSKCLGPLSERRAEITYDNVDKKLDKDRYVTYIVECCK